MSSLLAQSGYKVMKWKNGNGRSSEIAIAPGNAVFPNEPFLWRLSSAEISSNCTFSEFPGYDRYLVLVDGKGAKIQFGNEGKQFYLKEGDVHWFKGEVAATCTLENGPVRDLNLIYDRRQVNARFDVVRVEKKPRSFKIEGKTTLLFALRGKCSVEVFPEGDQVTLHAGDTFRIEKMDRNSLEQLVLLDPGDEDCLLAFIEV